MIATTWVTGILGALAIGWGRDWFGWSFDGEGFPSAFVSDGDLDVDFLVRDFLLDLVEKRVEFLPINEILGMTGP